MKELALLNEKRGFPLFFSDFLSEDWFSLPELKQKSAFMEWNEAGDEASISIEAPGFSKEDIKIESNSEGLIITGELTNDNTKKKVSQQSFSYILKRYDLDPKSVQAKLENGILEIQVKKEKDKKSKIIEIQ
jgi:HSP20 family molecular chaperone IbpA